MLTKTTFNAIVANLIALTAIDMVVWKKDSNYGNNFVATFAGDTYKVSSTDFVYINDVNVSGYSADNRAILNSLNTEIVEQMIGRPVLAKLDAAVVVSAMVLEELAFQLLLDDILGSVKNSDYKSGLDYASKTANTRGW